MKAEKFMIANMTQNGCENTIKKDLLTIAGVREIFVDIKNDAVYVRHKDEVERNAITNKLLLLGYPEATAENGLLPQLKSLSYAE